MTDHTDRLSLADYAQRAYLEYAMSVVKGRALPDVRDGQKPVQRRILFAMKDMGLNHAAKPVKSARVVGEILGKYHPHGDASAYDAMVRMAQEFTLRYPLIEGVGNFGSRDGDGAAAMRYTEARLTELAGLLLDELEQGTADFVPNYDGAFREPQCLPARLPMLLLNGASGIAVGMATEIPPHNLAETAAAAVALLKNPNLDTAALMAHIPAPDFAGGGHIITPAEDILRIYETGKGSLRVRARYHTEALARGQWRIVITELPPHTNAQKVLAEIEEQTNPKPKSGKKQLSQDQLNTKKLMLDLLERVRDESDGEQPVRLVLEPKSARIKPEHFINTLMAQTSLEGNVPVNLVMMGADGRPAQKNLKTILQEWLAFRADTVTRRLAHRLAQVEKRIHILEGRLTVFLHIDEVIAVIREADEPKAELMARFPLSETQADDILEIRLRQLARLEGIRLENELADLREEQNGLQHLLAHDGEKKKLIIKEIQADAKRFGDARRTLVQEAERAALTQSTADEPLTLILSQQGWIRSRAGHGLDLAQTAFKEGDALQQVLEIRSARPVVVLDTLGRSYTVDAADIPGGRGDGVPLASLIALQAGAGVACLLHGAPEHQFLLANSGGYGFIVRLEHLLTRMKAGKEVMKLERGETLLPPVPVLRAAMINPDSKIVFATAHNRLLAVSPAEIKVMAKGRGVQLLSLHGGDRLTVCAAVSTPVVSVASANGRGKVRTETLRIADIAGKRGRKGKAMTGADPVCGIFPVFSQE
ncbi:DNA topoisomerase IV subunit A [Conchiformibius kuhniae]|uniref:DNA topoisomerase 4 subunit A n=1 Tax=Conchiformibius kuhniae TaxID=211502 RepID=A0ABD8B7K0_9NEIS|nr:DNA topoisomerase IV subunit A [Conchiformibius kuhniae]